MSTDGKELEAALWLSAALDMSADDLLTPLEQALFDPDRQVPEPPPPPRRPRPRPLHHRKRAR